MRQSSGNGVTDGQIDRTGFIGSPTQLEFQKTIEQCQSRRSAVFIGGFEQVVVSMDKMIQLET